MKGRQNGTEMVFPVSTGMNRMGMKNNERIVRVPRKHGDEPRQRLHLCKQLTCSP